MNCGLLILHVSPYIRRPSSPAVVSECLGDVGITSSEYFQLLLTGRAGCDPDLARCQTPAERGPARPGLDCTAVRSTGHRPRLRDVTDRRQ